MIGWIGSLTAADGSFFSSRWRAAQRCTIGSLNGVTYPDTRCRRSSTDPELGLLRLRRAVGAYSAGRIINPRIARSQMIGGIVWGWGMAAMEHSPFDPQLGRFVSKDLAGVALPVNADIPTDITVHFVDELERSALAGRRRADPRASWRPSGRSRQTTDCRRTRQGRVCADVDSMYAR